MTHPRVKSWMPMGLLILAIASIVILVVEWVADHL